MLRQRSVYFHFEKKLCFISFLLLLSFISFAQQKVTVKGAVMSDKSVPLSNVSVKVDGAAIGTTTQSDGSFNLSVNKGAVLVFSIIGYEEKAH